MADENTPQYGIHAGTKRIYNNNKSTRKSTTMTGKNTCPYGIRWKWKGENKTLKSSPANQQL
jgi:hypothetical protein